MPPSSKHPRSTSESEADGDARAYKTIRSDSDALAPAPSSSTASASPATFWHLPIELRSIIFDLATQRRPKSNDSLGRRGLLRLDYVTLRSLTLVSRQFHAAFKPVLFAHVKITRPSVLAEFRRSLVMNPDNGLLVKSLHLGPLEELPKGYWPIRAKQDHDDESCCCYEDEPLLLLKTSLSWNDHAVRPRWCRPDMEWAIDLPARSCQGRAVFDAIKAAVEGVGVTLFGHPEFNDYALDDAEGNAIDLDEWTLRVFQVQALLDLYLGHMRRLEREGKRLLPSWRSKSSVPVPKGPPECRAGKCGHYPSLVVEGFQGLKRKQTSTSGTQLRSEDGKAALPQTMANNSTYAAAGAASRAVPANDDNGQGHVAVTREQVMEHLSRRGAAVDHFDHPVIFARSKTRRLSFDGGGKVVVANSHHPSEFYYFGQESEDEDDSPYYGHYNFNDEEFSDRSTSPRRGSLRRSPSLDSLIDEELDATQHEHIVALGRSTLRLTPGLENLSLTSWLFSCMESPQPKLKTLRYISAGPLLPSDSLPSFVVDLNLPGLEKLQVAGSILNLGAVECMGEDKKKRKWPNLRETQWHYGAIYVGGRNREEHLLNHINLLQGRRLASHSPHPSPSGNPIKPRSQKDAGEQVKVRFTEAHLHPNLVSVALNNAPSAEVRAAWLNGSPVSDAPHRVKLLESRAAKHLNTDNYNLRGQDLNVLRQQSERWWEERALEVEGVGQLFFL